MFFPAAFVVVCLRTIKLCLMFLLEQKPNMPVYCCARGIAQQLRSMCASQVGSANLC